jgi:hypothetical protein
MKGVRGGRRSSVLIPFGGGSDIFSCGAAPLALQGFPGTPHQMSFNKQKVQPGPTTGQALLNCVEDFTGFKRINIIMKNKISSGF